MTLQDIPLESLNILAVALYKATTFRVDWINIYKVCVINRNNLLLMSHQILWSLQCSLHIDHFILNISITLHTTHLKLHYVNMRQHTTHYTTNTKQCTLQTVLEILDFSIRLHSVNRDFTIEIYLLVGISSLWRWFKKHVFTKKNMFSQKKKCFHQKNMFHQKNPFCH